jgi:hypothetical protein
LSGNIIPHSHATFSIAAYRSFSEGAGYSFVTSSHSCPVSIANFQNRGIGTQDYAIIPVDCIPASEIVKISQKTKRGCYFNLFLALDEE